MEVIVEGGEVLHASGEITLDRTLEALTAPILTTYFQRRCRENVRKPDTERRQETLFGHQKCRRSVRCLDTREPGSALRDGASARIIGFMEYARSSFLLGHGSTPTLRDWYKAVDNLFGEFTESQKPRVVEAEIVRFERSLTPMPMPRLKAA